MGNRKVALVTGGSSGIGQAISVALARSGWDLVVQYGSNHDGAQLTKRLVDAEGARCATVSFDLAAMTSGQEFWNAVALSTAELAGPYGASDLPARFDALALNAGIDQRGPFAEFSLADIERMFHINTFVPTMILQCAPLHMNPGGSVAVTSSTGATTPIPTSVPYSMSKAAVNMLVRACAQVLAEHSIRVNGVAPGIVDTPLQTRERIAAFADSGLVGTPEDIASVVEFALSPASRWVNGQIITASGNA